MLEPLPVVASFKWLWPELVLLAGGILALLVAQSRDVSWLTPRRLAPITALIALAASFAVPFEPAALAGDLFRSDIATILAIRVILATSVAALVLGAHTELLYLALAGCLAARASDALSSLLALQFLGLTLVLLAVRSSTPPRVAARHLARGAAWTAVAAVGFACLIGATAVTSFASIGISLGHGLPVGTILTGLALFPVLVVAHGVLATFDIGAHLTDHVPARATDTRPDDIHSVTRTAARIIAPAGLILLLLRLTGSAFSGEVGGAANVLITTIPWRLVIGLVALGAMIRGTLQALTGSGTALIVSGLLLAQAGWLLAGAAQGTIDAARALLVAMVTGVPAALVFRPAPSRESSDNRIPGLEGATARLAGLVALLSMAGSPGTLGFIGRWDLFDSARIGPAWWLAAAGSILWGLSILAAIRWYFGAASNTARYEVAWSGRWIALALLGFSLAGPPIRRLVVNAFPFP